MPKVSVIIPIYNVEKYLKECLDSVVNQTLKDIEIICINDGSTDNSVEIIKEYAKKDNRILVINKNNEGVAKARNVGLNSTKSDLIYFLDPDDYIENDLLECAYKKFKEEDIDIFVFGCECFLEEKETNRDIDKANNYLNSKTRGLIDINFDVANDTSIHIWNKILKKEIIEKNNIEFPNNTYFEDIYFMWIYFFYCKKAYYDNKKYHHYRMLNTGLTGKGNKKAYDHIKNYNLIIKKLSKDKEKFIKNYKNFKILLKKYINRTKETSIKNEHFKLQITKIKLLLELEFLKRNLER